MRGCFVTGTDTGAGKTAVAAAIAAALAASGVRVAAFKPVVTGLDEPAAGGWPPDHELLAAACAAPGAAGIPAAAPDAAAVAPHTFGNAVSPHLAAAMAGVTIEPAALVAAAHAAAAGADVLVAEGVGGLLVPLTPGYSVRDLARDLGLPLVIAARPGLGTISHTLLTAEAARAVGLEVRAIVMTPWPASPSAMERSNRDTVARLAAAPVLTLAHIGAPQSSELALAGAALGPQSLVGPA